MLEPCEVTKYTKEQLNAFEWLPQIGSMYKVTTAETQLFYFKTTTALLDYYNNGCHSNINSNLKADFAAGAQFIVINIFLGDMRFTPAIVEIAFELPDIGKPYNPSFIPFFPPKDGGPQTWLECYKDCLTTGLGVIDFTNVYCT